LYCNKTIGKLQRVERQTLKAYDVASARRPLPAAASQTAKQVYVPPKARRSRNWNPGNCNRSTIYVFPWRRVYPCKLVSSLGLGCLASGDSGGSVEGARPRLPDCTVYLDRISLRLHRQQATH